MYNWNHLCCAYLKPVDKVGAWLADKFQACFANLAAVHWLPPHSIANGFKNLLDIAVNTDVELEQATTIKDPNKFAATANAPAAAVNMVKAQKLGIRRGGG